VITYREIRESQHLEAIVDLQGVVWQSSDRESTPHNTLLAIIHRSGSIIGAFDGERVIGFTLAFISRFDDTFGMWSHMAAVHPDYQRQGIGFQLKHEHRLWCLREGYRLMKWTFDPLQRGNANFNLRQLGGYSNSYHVNFYGAMTDGLNQGMPSDRLEITWDMLSERVTASAQQTLPLVTTDYPARAFLLTQNADQSPKRSEQNLTQPYHFAEIPYDINTLKQNQMDLALDWRFALRDVMLRVLEEGYRVVDFVTQDGRCWYVFEKHAI
jgi:predicted GNAT superfamily acetyltransferase